jgi:hypothetical protein
MPTDLRCGNIYGTGSMHEIVKPNFPAAMHGTWDNIQHTILSVLNETRYCSTKLDSTTVLQYKCIADTRHIHYLCQNGKAWLPGCRRWFSTTRASRSFCLDNKHKRRWTSRKSKWSGSMISPHIVSSRRVWNAIDFTICLLRDSFFIATKILTGNGR